MALNPTNSDLIADRLRSAGVRYAFGVPSGQVLALIEALRRAGIEFILVSHEGAAGFMADVVGRLTGVPGVAIATLGPGATNLTTGIGNAFLDRSPVLAITAQVPTSQLQRRVQMRVDHHRLFEPLTKATLQLASGSISATLSQALAIATAEPAGPVHLDLPEDVAVALVDSAERAAAPPLPQPVQLASENDLTRTMELLRTAKRPVAVLGFSLYRSGALPELGSFLEANHLPFVTTNMAKGVVPEDHPLWLGVVGRALRKTIEEYLGQADLILGLGYDPVEICYEEWMPPVPLVHVSNEAADVAETVLVAHQAIGDLGSSIRRLNTLSGGSSNEWDDSAMAGFRARLERQLRLPGDGFQPWQALDVMRELLPADALLACDVGAHTHLVATQWRVTVPETLLVSNGWSSMGYAIPAALAAKLCHPKRTVAAVLGDGCFLMMAGEMATAARIGLPVVFVVLNDSWLSLIKVKQERREYAYTGVVTQSESHQSPAAYFGVPNLVARNPEAFRAALLAALDSDGPTVVEALVRPELYSTILYG